MINAAGDDVVDLVAIVGTVKVGTGDVMLVMGKKGEPRVTLHQTSEVALGVVAEPLLLLPRDSFLVLEIWSGQKEVCSVQRQ